MGTTHLPAAAEGSAAVLGFTGHILLAADVDADWLARTAPVGDPGAMFNPPFLGALEQHLGLRVNNIDVLLLAPSEPPAPDPEWAQVPLIPVPALTHPRVGRARRYRTDLRIFTGSGGVLVLGRGLAGRWEVAVEVDPTCRGRGIGRRLAAHAARLVPPGEPLWAQVAPGNAASLRAFLAAGYLPVGQEALLVA
jgi:GNAT superfamily N-acetyltransferase